MDEIPEGKLIHREIEGRSLCFLRRGRSVYAFKDICPHVGGRLSDGNLSEKNHVSCPVHGAVFDILSGDSLSFSRRGLSRYEVLIEDGVVRLGAELEAKWKEKLPDPQEENWELK